MSALPPPFGLFSGLGIELEYMIVDAQTLCVRPIADQLIRAECGAYQSEVERGEMAWSNELALHLIEIKTNGPVASLAGVAEKFQAEVRHINKLLEAFGARLMPTAMHPWMDPARETRLWPHDYNPVYRAFDRVFDCRGHGWSNLQSCHLNFPFSDDAEFGRLHAAIRLVLPLLPALAASSPFQDGGATGCLDNRLNAYRANCARILSVTGKVIPEPVFSQRDYETQILQRMYRDIAPFDPDGTLQNEWLNARGAIARFERNTIEIRLLDVQESPQADVAIAGAVQALVQRLVQDPWTDLPFQQAIPTETLETIFLATMNQAEEALISDTAFLQIFGLAHERSISARELWRWLLKETLARRWSKPPAAGRPLQLILEQGTLARRILHAAARAPSRTTLEEVYDRLCSCLAQGRLFEV